MGVRKGTVNDSSAVVDGVYSTFLPDLHAHYEPNETHSSTGDSAQPEVLHVFHSMQMSDECISQDT